MKRQVARSKTCFLGIDGLNDPVEFVQRLQFAEGGRLHAAIDLPLVAHQQLILQDQFQELGVAELVAGGFLQPHVQGFGQAREPQLRAGWSAIDHSW